MVKPEGKEMSVKRYEVNGSSSVLEDETGSLVDYEDYAALEQRLIESERYGRQTDITIDNLEMKLAQMAAELASVKQQEPKAWFIRITDEVTVDAREGEKWRGVPLVRVDVETPNHDAFLAEVRAQGVEMFADDLLCPDLDNTIREFAEQLRKGGVK
jgi:hypothetical protein